MSLKLLYISNKSKPNIQQNSISTPMTKPNIQQNSISIPTQVVKNIPIIKNIAIPITQKSSIQFMNMQKQVKKLPEISIVKSPETIVEKKSNETLSDKQKNKLMEKMLIYKNISSIKKFNYVINLNRRQDRWTNFLKIIEKTNLKNETFIRIEAYDAKIHQEELKRISSDIYKNIINTFIKNKTYFKKSGELGCLMSHVLTLDAIIKNKDINQNDYVSIFEDDIDYCIDFEKNYEKLQNINLNKLNIDFLYTGGRNLKNYNNKHELFQETINENIYYRPYNINNINPMYYDRCTFSYIVRKSACNKILININNAIDRNFKDLAIDHIYTNCMRNIRMFDFLPHLFYSPLIYNSDVQINTHSIHF